MKYTYKGNDYFLELDGSESIKMKQQDGSWEECVIYSPVDDEDVIYVRESDDFYDKFIEVEEDD